MGGLTDQMESFLVPDEDHSVDLSLPLLLQQGEDLRHLHTLYLCHQLEPGHGVISKGDPLLRVLPPVDDDLPADYDGQSEGGVGGAAAGVVGAGPAGLQAVISQLLQPGGRAGLLQRGQSVHPDTAGLPPHLLCPEQDDGQQLNILENYLNTKIPRLSRMLICTMELNEKIFSGALFRLFKKMKF